jgi:hypothetical protein
MAVLVGWIELILLPALLLFFGSIYWLYWVKKRKLAVGLFFLIAVSVFFLYSGTVPLALWMGLVLAGQTPFPPLDLSNTLGLVLGLAMSVSFTGSAIYGLLSAYRALRTYLKS